MIGWRRGPERGAPRILLLGPAGAGKTTLVQAAVRAAGPGDTTPAVARGGRADWCDVGGSVIIDVPGAIALPPPGMGLTAWEALLRHLRRLRPRRPLDAIILALPAPLLLDPGSEDERLHLAASIRDRFALVQGLLGFTLPVYVIITKADEIPGFETFTGTLTAEQLRNMFGWSNPYGIDQPFSTTWIDHGIAALHDAVVSARVERFASSTHLADRGDLFLFTRTLEEIAPPLRTLLGDVFRPSLYREAFACRGFYLCGRLSDDATSIAFLDDLLAEKVSAERGLATPVNDVAEARRRSAIAAQIVCALLVLALGFGLSWSYDRLRRAEAEFLALLSRAEAVVAVRAQGALGGRPLPASSRLQQTRGLVNEELRAINNDGLSWIIYGLNPSLRDTLTRIFRDIVLADFRVALEHKGRRWLLAAQDPTIDPPPSGPDFQDRPRYQALVRFAQGYSPLVDSYQRYEDLRRPDGRETIAALAAISEYVDGTPLEVHALGRPYARALRNANATPIDCGIFQDTSSGESRVAVQAAALLDEFRDWTFDESNPVRSAARDLSEDWEIVASGSGIPEDLEFLIRRAKELSTAVTAWATLDTAIANQSLALFEQVPFTPRAAASAACSSLLWPDLGGQLQGVERSKERLREQLLAIEIEPFGPLFTDDAAGLALSEPVDELKKDLDTLASQPFWAPPAEGYAEESARSPLPRFATWRAEDLDAVVKTADAFANYRGGAFNTIEQAPRDALLNVVEVEVADVAAARLRRTAVTGPALPPDPAALLEQLRVTGSVVAKLTPIAPLLARSQSGAAVLSALDSQAAGALAALDRTASREYPWLFSWPRRAGTLDALFSRWQTIRHTAPPADAAKLWEAAADDSRDAVVRLSMVAKPFAIYLVARRGLSEPALRWARIGRDVTSFEQKLPDNGLSVLDAFVRRGVPAMLPANACGGGSSASARAVGEYFPPLRDELVREGERQCRMQIQRDYATIVGVFNAQLRDRFPFVESPSAAFADRVRAVQGRPEATLDGVKRLLEVYRSVDGPGATRFLESTGACSSDPALAFLQRVENASNLLASVADPGLKTPTIVLDVLPEFRLAPEAGTGGDHIAEWRIDIGSRSATEPLPAPATPLPWTYGDLVSLTVRFARDSPTIPAPGAGVRLREPEAEDRRVRFDFTGNWALFQLLLARTVSTDADALLVRDLAPTVLAFDIPVQPDSGKPPLAKAGLASPFELYARVGIFLRGKTEVLHVGPLPTRPPPTLTCLGT